MPVRTENTLVSDVETMDVSDFGLRPPRNNSDVSCLFISQSDWLQKAKMKNKQNAPTSAEAEHTTAPQERSHATIPIMMP